MELKPGYMRTYVGVIPDDWIVRPLGGLVRITSGASPSMLRFSGNGIPYFKVEQLSNSEKHLQASDTPYLFRHGDTVPGQSVIFAKRGAAIALNKVRILKQPSFMDTNLMVLTPQHGLACEYLYYALGYIGLWRFADTTSVPQINNKHIKPLPFPLPPTMSEQEAIAGALGDADALIESLDRLIAKKRDVKQAAMQQLLTGQTRLPGFSGEWEVKRLGEVGVFTKGSGIKKDEVVEDGLPCIRYGEIYTHHNDHVRTFNSFITPATAKESQRLEKGDLLFAGSGETAEEIGKCVAFLANQEAYAGGDIVILRPCGQSAEYLGYLLNHSSVAAQKSQMGQGDAVVHISARNLARVKVHLPPLPEQVGIAAVLMDMDEELAALEQRRAKTRSLKQGMMQELLTGKTRLI